MADLWGSCGRNFLNLGNCGFVINRILMFPMASGLPDFQSEISAFSSTPGARTLPGA